MQELTASANFVEYETFAEGRSIVATVARDEVEAALSADESAQLWFELAGGDGGEPTRLTLDVSSADLEEMLRLSTGDEVGLALDGTVVADLFDDSDVEAHGLRGALAIAVTAAAVAAPASLAATPQNVAAAATAQRANLAATAPQADMAATAQVANLATKAQVTSAAAKTQINKTLIVKASGLKLLRRGLAR